MIPRSLALPGLLGAAIAGPVVISNAPEDWQAPWGNAAVTTAADSQPSPGVTFAPLPTSTLQDNNSPIYRSPAPLGGAVVSIDEAFRMDVNPQWVYARWARKSTGLADPELFGVRTPLVTGSRMTDLAGALSYYFDAEGVVQRLRFHGRTADTTQVVALAVQRFGMQRQQGAPGEQLFQKRSRSGVEAELRTRPEAVLWGTSPHSSFVVDIEVNRPGSGRFVQPPTPQLALPEPPAPPVQPIERVAQQTPAQPPALQPADAGQESAEGEDRSLLGLTPGRLPPTRWPH